MFDNDPRGLARFQPDDQPAPFAVPGKAAVTVRITASSDFSETPRVHITTFRGGQTGHGNPQ